MPDADERVAPATLELPVEGYPISAKAVAEWFERRHGRQPSELELGDIMLAMAQREATAPVEMAPDLEGWQVGPESSPPHRA